MKGLFYLVTLAYLAFHPYYAQAQTDSTEIKLNQYKDWYEKGLINQQEYDDLRRKTLDLGNTPPKAAEKTKDKPATSYKGKLIGGSIFLATGTSFIAGGVYLKRNPRLIYVPTIKGYAYDYRKARRGGNGLIVMGSLQLALGAFLLSKGVHGLIVYNNGGRQATLGITPNGELGFTWKW